MDKLQKLLDSKVADLKLYSDKGLLLVDELNESVVDENKTEKDLSEKDLEVIFDVKLINNVITNKIISILEIKYLSEELEETLNFDEFLKIPNTLDFELTYKEFKENQKFFKIINGEVKKDESLTSEHFKKYKEEIKKLEGN